MNNKNKTSEKMSDSVKPFPFRALSKTQLALYYKDEACYNTLMSWLKNTVRLLPDLFSSEEYNPHGHILNSHQVLAFIVHHGPPEGYSISEDDSRVASMMKRIEAARERLHIPKKQKPLVISHAVKREMNGFSKMKRATVHS